MTEELKKYRSLCLALVIGLIVSILVFTAALRVDLNRSRHALDYETMAYGVAAATKLQRLIDGLEHFAMVYRDVEARAEDRLDFLNRAGLAELIKGGCILQSENSYTTFGHGDDRLCAQLAVLSQDVADGRADATRINIVSAEQSQWLIADLAGVAGLPLQVALPAARIVENFDDIDPYNYRQVQHICLRLLVRDITVPLACHDIGKLRDDDGATQSLDAIDAASALASDAGMGATYDFTVGAQRWRIDAAADMRALSSSVSALPFLVLVFFLCLTGLVSFWVYSATGKNIALARQQRALQQLVAEVEARNEDLNQFAYMAAHDLQTPLRFVAAHVHLLEDEIDVADGAEARSLMQTITEQVERMRALVLDMLSFCRAGQQTIAPEAVNVRQTLQEIWTEIGASFDTSHIRFETTGLPLTQVVDPMAFRQIMTNLLSNSVKYGCGSARPEVTVSSSYDEAAGAWRYSVADNGSGIEETHQRKAFLPFQRLDTSKEGTGIGLAIVRKLVESHGGDIRIEPPDHSDPGTRITFTLKTISAGSTRKAA